MNLMTLNHKTLTKLKISVISKYDFEKNNLKNNTLKTILNNEWFTKILPDSWKNPDTAPIACQRNCKVE